MARDTTYDFVDQLTGYHVFFGLRLADALKPFDTDDGNDVLFKVWEEFEFWRERDGHGDPTEDSTYEAGFSGLPRNVEIVTCAKRQDWPGRIWVLLADTFEVVLKCDDDEVFLQNETSKEKAVEMATAMNGLLRRNKAPDEIEAAIIACSDTGEFEFISF
jgi:hypothetical protein